jgi:hypothetical protein
VSESNTLYAFPQFRSRLRTQGALRVSDAFDFEIDGLVYHHRGARIPGYEATFVWEDGGFSLEIDTVGDREAWVVFDAEAGWDVFVGEIDGQPPFLAWMSDTEFDAEESDIMENKSEAMRYGRFSFACYVHRGESWQPKHRRAQMKEIPFFLHRPDGRTVVPDSLESYAEAIPPELRGGEPPDYLGIQNAVVEYHH